MTSSENIGWFGQIRLSDRPTVGGKGGSLGELTQAGISVPPGFVVRTAAFERFLEPLDQQHKIRSEVEALHADDLAGIALASTKLRQLLQNAQFPESLQTELRAAHTQLCADVTSPVAVRSSATTEDAEDASFAGLQDTLLWVRGFDSFLAAIKQCWASLYSTESMAYRRKRVLPETGVAMAVVVQRMVDARSAGVMFTRSPTTGDKSVITIESAWGLGSAVVSGEVTPDRFVVGKITGEISVREIKNKHVMHVPIETGGTTEVATEVARCEEPSVSDDELQQLRVMGRRIEKHYGRPQDIEWAFDKQGALHILQSRPETVWSIREAAPVTAPVADPLQHVMSIFGGKS
jgi:pyruvate, water dikinase